MSAANPRSEHELDAELADANMFAWYVPTFALAFKHWPISLAVGLAALGLDWALARLPWPYFGGPWWVQLSRAYLDALTYLVLVAAAYRFLAEREGVGTVNEWGETLFRAAAIATIWVVGGALVFGGFTLATMAVGIAVVPDDAQAFLALGAFVLVVLLVAFLLMPIWFSLGVASALSSVHAVRSLEGPFGAIGASLRLAFGQKWRVFWPSYLLAILVIALFVAAFFMRGPFVLRGVWLVDVATFLSTALGVTMTFVIERAYAPHLAATDAGALDAAARPADGPSPPRGRGAPVPVAALPEAPRAVADLLAADVQGHRFGRVVETVEHGLKADARFFLPHADHTLSVAKRLSAAQRADLALRLVQPYLKEHRGHRQHLTVALFVANLLREQNRLQDAAKFLTQVKVMYSHEPMVDQLIKITAKAIAATGAGAAAPAGPQS